MEAVPTPMWPGVIVAMDTPFADDGSVATDRLRVLLDFLAAAGVNGVFTCGGTGQGGVLSVTERLLVTAVVTQHLRGELPVLVHAGAPITADCIALARDAQEKGAAAVVISSPNWYYKHEDAAVHDHFRLICAAVDIPVYLYRRPTDTWPVDTVSALRREFQHFAGIKDSATNFDLTLKLIDMTGFAVYQGYEPLATASLMAGAAGLVSGLATIFPEEVVRLYQAFRAKDWEVMQKQQQRVNNLVAWTYRPSAYRNFKTVLEARGYQVGEVRRPFLPATPEEKAALLRLLRNNGLLADGR